MSSTEPNDRRAALRFALGSFVVLAAIGLWAALRKHHPQVGVALGGAGGLLLALGLVAPGLVLTIRRGWMAFAAVLGWVNSRIILSVLFFGVLTPISLLRRLFGADPLQMRWSPGATQSYWRLRDEPYDPKHYEHHS